MLKLTVVLLCCVALSAVTALPPKAQILADGLKAVNYWRANHDQYCGWEDGTLMIGVATLQGATGDEALRDFMLAFGEKFAWKMCLALGGGAWNPDNQLVAASYAELYLNSAAKNASWVAPTIGHLDASIQARAATTRQWTWVDALYMGTAVHARIGAITGQSKYFDQAWAAFNLSAFTPHPAGYAFWSPAEQLFYRDPPKATPNGVFWARGNGWVAAALADVLRLSPPGHAAVPVYTAAFKAFMARLAGLQGADGCWRTSLTDPDFFPVPETTGTSMFAYAMSYGITSGHLDAATFLPVVEKAWGCLKAVSLHQDGRLGNCQPGGAGPQRNFGPDSINSFCVGQFALAAAGVAQLAA